MTEVYIDALHDYLNGPEWHQSIQIFVDSNCKYFSNVSELDHQQHALWKTFQEIVETVLEMALQSIGGSFQQLEDAIDALQSQPSRGPRDEKTKDLLTQLMSFTDFAVFAAMMNQAYKEINDACLDERRSNDKYVDALLRLGFPLEAIEATIQAAEPHASLEDLVISVSGYQYELPERGARISFAHCNVGDSKYHYDVHDSAPDSPCFVEKPEDAFTAPLAKFASDAANDGEMIDLNELNAKFVIADSVLDSFDNSARMDLASGSAMQALLRWSEDMRMLRHDISIAYEEQLPSVAMCFNCKDGLVEWYRQLERARQEIDQANAAGNILSDAELHRMAELDKIAAMGTADEQLLHSLISRHDQVCKEVEALQRQASLLMASDSTRGVRRETLEELYVFLKQQVANGTDLEAVGDEMHERVYSAVSSSRGADVVNMLLDMHIHEDEQSLLESRIHSIVGSPGREDITEQAAVKLSDLELDDVTAAAKGDVDSATAHSVAAQALSSNIFAADSKVSAGGLAAFPVVSAVCSVDEPHVQLLKDQHRAALAQLKQLLATDKERRLQALEDKLVRRRALLQKSSQPHQCAVPAALEAEQLYAVEQVEAEILQVQDSCELREESMVSGFKKRCTSELAIARAKRAGSDDKKYSAADWKLTEEERSESHRLAAHALKERFEREQKALLASLDQERHKQRERVLKQLAAKRKKSHKTGQTMEELRTEEREALVAMNVEFDQMQATALEKAQERAFLALAAIHVSGSQLDSQQEGRGNGVEEGSYLDEGDQCSSSGRHWLQAVDQARAGYTCAAEELQLRLRASAVSSIGERTEGTALSVFAETAGIMSRVIADAFEKQCQEEYGDQATAANKLFGSASGKNGGAWTDTARVRAGIMEEFERAKRELDDSFAHSQQAGRNRIDLRRQSRSQHKGAADDQKEGVARESPEDNSELMRAQHLLLEGVVDGYLGGDPVPDIAALYIQLEHKQAARSSSGEIYSAVCRESQEWDESGRLKERARIKSLHVEKEQSLLLQLEADMLNKKRALEDRLRRRRQSAAVTVGGETGVSEEGEDLEQQEQLLEQAFTKISAHLRGMSAEHLAKLDVRAMTEFLERSSQGEFPDLSAPELSSASFETNATLIQPASKAGTDETESTGLDVMEAWNSTSAGRSREEKESMAGEVKRISLEYSEEKQKLDLMMKIQQARQRQALQRKLFEKSQRKARQQQMAQEGQENEAADSKSVYNSVEIGANRGLAALKLRSPSSLQQAFKGLPPEAYLQQGDAPSTGGGAGYSSSSSKPRSQQSMAMRGMNLGPMMRK